MPGCEGIETLALRPMPLTARYVLMHQSRRRRPPADDGLFENRRSPDRPKGHADRRSHFDGCLDTPAREAKGSFPTDLKSV